MTTPDDLSRPAPDDATRPIEPPVAHAEGLAAPAEGPAPVPPPPFGAAVPVPPPPAAGPVLPAAGPVPPAVVPAPGLRRRAAAHPLLVGSAAALVAAGLAFGGGVAVGHATAPSGPEGGRFGAIDWRDGARPGDGLPGGQLPGGGRAEGPGRHEGRGLERPAPGFDDDGPGVQTVPGDGDGDADG